RPLVSARELRVNDMARMARYDYAPREAIMEFFYDLYVVDLGPQRLDVMIFLRGLLNFSIQEIKPRTSSLPLKVASGPMGDLRRLSIQLEELGAKIDYQIAMS